MVPYLSEFIGTALLVLLGDGVGATCTLKKTLFAGSSTVYIMLGWGLAVMLPAMAFGAQSGAHFNPALTIALAVAGKFKWSLVPGYIIAQMLGGFVGACLVMLNWKDHFKDAKESGVDDATLRGIFCTGPAIRNLGTNCMNEAFATFALVFFIVCITPTAGDVGLNYWFVNAIILSCGFSLGSTTGFAMNPARDTAPRAAFSLVMKGDGDWAYAWVPIVGPIIGGILGALLGVVVTGWL
jgi:glycerol uptake facilitator protein